MGIRRKIFFGFFCVALMLLFASAISTFELRKLGRESESILEEANHNLSLSKRLLDGVQKESQYVMMALITGQKHDQVLMERREEFNQIIKGSAETIKDMIELESIASIKNEYNKLVDSYLVLLDSGNKSYHSTVKGLISRPLTEQENSEKIVFLEEHGILLNQLTDAIKNHMILSQHSLSTKSEMLKDSAHRAVAPSMLTLYVALVMIFVFAFIIDLYFAKPVVRVTKGVKEYLNNRAPFNVEVEGQGEIKELRDGIEVLIARGRERV